MPEPESKQETGWVDLSDLRLMPDWVAGIGAHAPAARKEHGGQESHRDERPRREGRGGAFREGGRQERGDWRERRGRRDRDSFGGKGKDHGPRHDRRDHRDRPEPVERAPLPTDISVNIEPEETAVDALAAHIRTTGRAFSMFDASRLVLAGQERFRVRFVCAPERQSGLFRVLADGSLFLSREEAISHRLQSGVLEEFYQSEEIELEEPKGDFKSVAVCGMTGDLLGPPSHHSYQTTLLRLHREKFPTMPLDAYKRRIRVEADPELIAKWKEQQRKGMRWTWLKGETPEGGEPLVLRSRTELEDHFRRHHAEEGVAEVREALVHGNAPRHSLNHALHVLLRRGAENAQKNLFEFSQRLGAALEHRGLKLFKRRGGKLFVSRIKPHGVDPSVVFSERVTRIVNLVRDQPGILLSKLLEAIAPAPQQESPATAPAETATPAPAAAQLTDDQIAALKDLRWLADAGYIIEYSDGAVFLGVQGEPTQPKAAKSSPKAAATEAGPPTGEGPGSAPQEEVATPETLEASDPPPVAAPEESPANSPAADETPEK